jgi:hypothetical protein
LRWEQGRDEPEKMSIVVDSQAQVGRGLRRAVMMAPVEDARVATCEDDGAGWRGQG